MTENRSSQVYNPDSAILPNLDLYEQYFSLLDRVFSMFLACYFPRDDQSSRPWEAQVVPAFTERLLATVRALRLKYRYLPDYRGQMLIDLTQSGFPNYQELQKMQADMETAGSELAMLPGATMLSRQCLDHLFKAQTEPEDILAKLAERNYLESLDTQKIFFSFVPGDLVLRDETDKIRNYVFTWACYDSSTNRPYIHIMTFDQDADQEPLEDNGLSYEEFIRVVKAEGSRAPEMLVLAKGIDDRLETIHPKIVKRICIGALYSPLLMSLYSDNTDPLQPVLQELFEDHGEENDFVLFFNDSVIISARQKVTKNLLSRRSTVREVFKIVDTDPELYKHLTTIRHRHVLMPHRFLQNISPEMAERIGRFDELVKITYDRKGAIHGV